MLDELSQMNIGEIRTRIHQLLMRPVIRAYCRETMRPRLQRVLDRLLNDETRHIKYTARLIDRLSSGREQAAISVFSTRLAEFNEITLREVGQAQFIGE
jgi:uncharacterized ferritin-like protein (DUF455 family)